MQIISKDESKIVNVLGTSVYSDSKVVVIAIDQSYQAEINTLLENEECGFFCFSHNDLLREISEIHYTNQIGTLEFLRIEFKV
jgi:hypothetical protein